MILGKCLFCDQPLDQPERGRNKKFCNENCRKSYQPYKQAEEELHGLGR